LNENQVLGQTNNDNILIFRNHSNNSADQTFSNITFGDLNPVLQPIPHQQMPPFNPMHPLQFHNQMQNQQIYNQNHQIPPHQIPPHQNYPQIQYHQFDQSFHMQNRIPNQNQNPNAPHFNSQSPFVQNPNPGFIPNLFNPNSLNPNQNPNSNHNFTNVNPNIQPSSRGLPVGSTEFIPRNQRNYVDKDGFEGDYKTLIEHEEQLVISYSVLDELPIPPIRIEDEKSNRSKNTFANINDEEEIDGIRIKISLFGLKVRECYKTGVLFHFVLGLDLQPAWSNTFSNSRSHEKITLLIAPNAEVLEAERARVRIIDGNLQVSFPKRNLTAMLVPPDIHQSQSKVLEVKERQRGKK